MTFGYCLCLGLYVCIHVSVNHELVRAITHDLVKQESPNLGPKMHNILLNMSIVLGAD